MCFCAGTLADLGLSWINKYDNKTTSRWKQVPVLINDLFETFISKDSFKMADSIVKSLVFV